MNEGDRVKLGLGSHFNSDCITVTAGHLISNEGETHTAMCIHFHGRWNLADEDTELMVMIPPGSGIDLVLSLAGTLSEMSKGEW